jgi:hypothetical protein
MNITDQPSVEQLLACPILLKDTNSYETIRPETWFTFATYESGKNNRNRRIAIMRAP